MLSFIVHAVYKDVDFIVHAVYKDVTIHITRCLQMMLSFIVPAVHKVVVIRSIRYLH